MMQRALLIGVLLGTAVVSAGSRAQAPAMSPAWTNTFTPADTGPGFRGWGLQNTTWLILDLRDVLRVRFPAQSIDPAASKRDDRPLGGMGVNKRLFPEGQDCALLEYAVRFPIGFQFVRGGKLPGLYGGIGNSGGRIPNGSDGFSTRYMWLENGRGQIYAYLPTSVNYGTGLGSFRFQPGRWHQLRQRVTLNTPGVADGSIEVWLDDELVISARDLLFRTDPRLRIDGLMFSTFFGGNDQSWATPVDTYIDFANMRHAPCI